MNETAARAAAAERVMPKHDPGGTPADVVCTAPALAAPCPGHPNRRDDPVTRPPRFPIVHI